MDLIGFEEPLVNFTVGIYSAVVGVLGADITNFFIMALGIAVYGIILGTFYKTFSREKFFVLEHTKDEGPVDEIIHLLALILKYTLAFPVITFVWFMFLTLFLVFLGSQSAADVMYIAIAVVAATRITAYWDEGISEDLAKMLPLGLLAFFIGNPSILDATVFEQKFFEITQVLPMGMQYFVYIILLEWILRICVGVRDFVIQHKKRIVPAPILSRIPAKLPTLPRKVRIPSRKSRTKPAEKTAKKPAEKPGKPKKAKKEETPEKEKEKKGRESGEEGWELGV